MKKDKMAKSSFFEHLQQKYHLVEAEPQLTTFTHKLHVSAENRKVYEEAFKGKGNLLETLQQGVSLQAFDSAIALLDERKNAAFPISYVYFFEEKLHRDKTACFEQYLWKDNKGDLKDIRIGELRVAQYVFFYLVDQYNAVVSDQQHSPEGANWWKNTVGKALARNLDVFAENEFGTVRRIDSEEHFKKLFDLLWGKEEKFKMRILVVARKNYYKETDV